ncbi:MAG: aquaporin [Bryobacteraceae bacterium]|nr:aquaporin [Bryobacteraceae bacterium]
MNLRLVEALRSHWPEYLCEAGGLGIFMFTTCVFTVLLEHPMSRVHELITSAFVRRAIAGVALGATLLAIYYSPMGKRSGAHLNPAFTINFALLGKVKPADTLFYVMFQILGGTTGVLVAWVLTGMALENTEVNFAVTAPGPRGPFIAFVAELLISFGLMFTVLVTANTPRLTMKTPWFAAALVAAYVTWEKPLSGMSLNPARTLASAIPARYAPDLWVYLTAPLLGMFLAAQLYRLLFGMHSIYCVKLNHHNRGKCIFRCRYAELSEPRS